MNNAPEQADFWQQQALNLLAQRHAPTAGDSSELPSELLEQLWAFAEGGLDDDQAPALWAQAQANPAARAELARIYAAIEATAAAPTGDAESVWKQVTGPAFAPARAGAPAPGMFDLVIQLARQGLEVLSTTGRPAFAAAAARSGAQGPTHTAALEFLTSAGTFQVVVDQIDEKKVNLNVQATRTLGRFDESELELEIRYPSHALLGTVPFVNRLARVDDLAGGVYELVLARGGQPLASLFFDVKPSA